MPQRSVEGNTKAFWFAEKDRVDSEPLVLVDFSKDADEEGDE